MCLFWQSKIWCHLLLVTMFAEPAAAHPRHQVHHPEPAASKAMGQGESTQGEGQEGVDQYHYRPGPPATIHLTMLVQGGDPMWWAQKCATPSCRSWVWLNKTKYEEYQACALCQKPWVTSFQEIGPHYLMAFPTESHMCRQWPLSLLPKNKTSMDVPCLVVCCKAMFVAMSFGLFLGIPLPSSCWLPRKMCSHFWQSHL